MNSEWAVSIEDLSVIYDRGRHETRAVDHLDLQIKSGEVFGLLGPNGAGKSSIISSITGLLDIQQGQILIFGEPAGSLKAKKFVGVVPQELVHHGYFTVNEILNFFSGYYGLARNQKRIDYLLDRLALKDKAHKKVSQLSGGMKRRLLIAKALVHSPRLLLLDEPSAGVDVELRTLLWEFIQELNESGTTILLTTHYLEEAQRLCHRVAIMNQGQLLTVDSTGQMISKLAGSLVRFKFKSEKTLAQIDWNGLPAEIEVKKKEGQTLELKVNGGLSLSELCRLLAVPLEEIQDIHMEEGALEEAFLKVLTQRSGVSV